MAWLGSWAKRIKVTIDSAQVSDALSNFPVPIYLSASSGQSNDDVSAVFDELTSNANRFKIAVTTSNGTTECKVEIERWDDASEKAWLHVKVPSISSSADTELYLYYDSSHADNTTNVGDVGSTPGNNVWDSSFQEVFHLGEDPSGGSGAIKDSTSNGRDGTSAGTMLTEDLVDGKFGKCLEFDGSDDGVSATGHSPFGDTELTIEAVFNPTSLPGAGYKDSLVKNFTGGNTITMLQIDNNLLRFYSYITTTGAISVSSAALSTSTWYYGAGTWKSGESIDVRVNGSEVNGSVYSGTINRDGTGWDIAHWSNVAGRFFDGKVCEVRISNVKRTDAWLKATYEGLWDNLLTFGSEASSSSVSVSSGSVSSSASISESSSVSTSSSSSSESVSVSQSSSSESVSNSISVSVSSSSSSESVSVSASSSSSSLTASSWLSGWEKRIKVTLDKDQIDATLSDFPIPIYLSTSSGQTNVDVSCVFDELTSDANRKKIAVTRSDGTTECYVEIEKWDDASEKAWLHVKIHSVSPLQDSFLYLYYDSDHADNTTYVGDVGDTPAQSVWDSDFEFVAHMGEDPTGGVGCIKDSTANLNNGTPAGSMTSGDLIDGQFGKCLDFDGADDIIDHLSGSNLDDLAKKTVEAIIDPDTFGGGQTGNVVAKGVSNLGDNRGWKFTVHSGYGMLYSQYASGSHGQWSMPFTIGNLQHVALTHDNSSLSNDPLLYKDGVLQTVTEQNTPSGSYISESSLKLTVGGTLGDYSSSFDGRIDEVRISSVLRSAAWIKATYKGLFDDLLTFSTEQSSQSVSTSSSSSSESVSNSISASASQSSSSESASPSSSSSQSVSSSSASSESISQSSSSLSSESISSESISVSYSSSSSSHDPIVYAETMSLEMTTHESTIIGFTDPSAMSIIFETKTATFPLYGRMAQPIITGSKPKVICEASKAYIDFEGRDAKIRMSGY